MKHIYPAIIALLLVFNLSAQQVADFEDLSLSPDSYWNGSDESGSFTSSGVTFYNNYTPDWFSWDGFAYSSMTDSVTAGYLNQYSVISASGHNQSSNYAVAFPFSYSIIEFSGEANVQSAYINNATYSYLSMRDGDDYAKKFGGIEGNDPDYFLLYIEGLNQMDEPSGTVLFYLADFTSDDNSKDYIVKDWTEVDLTALGQVKKLRFSLASSDNGDFGMNTPGYFCLDNLAYLSSTGINSQHIASVNVFPNPFVNSLSFKGFSGKADIVITDISGKVVRQFYNLYSNERITGLETLSDGVYLVRIVTDSGIFSSKLIKK